MKLHLRHAFFLVPLLAASARAQSVWVVDSSGGGDFVDLPDAVLAAQDGDVLLVKTGSYGQVVLDGKGLAIVADQGADVVVNKVDVSNLTAGQSFLARGLDLLEQDEQGDNCVSLRSNAGPTWFEDCVVHFSTDDFSAIKAGNGVQAIGCESVTLVGCDVHGGAILDGSSAFFGDSAAGLWAFGSRVAALGTNFTGPKGALAGLFEPMAYLVPTAPGGPAIRVLGGELFLYDCTLVGGDGGDASIVQGECRPGADGGPGLAAQDAWGGGPPVLLVAASSMQGGLPGDDGDLGCGTGVAGPETFLDGGFVTTIAVDGAPRLLAAPAVVREGRVVALEFSGGELGEQIFLGISFGADTALHPEYENAIVLAEPIYVSLVGAMPPSGMLGASFPIPELAPGIQGLPLYLQSLHVGADAHLGTGSAVVVVDGAL